LFVYFLQKKLQDELECLNFLDQVSKQNLTPSEHMLSRQHIQPHFVHSHLIYGMRFFLRYFP